MNDKELKELWQEIVKLRQDLDYTAKWSNVTLILLSSVVILLVLKQYY